MCSVYKALCSTVVLVALAALGGCSKSGDSLTQQHIDQMNELADALEAKADQAKLDEISKRMKETAEAIKDLDLSDAQREKLAEKYGAEMGKATARLMKAMGGKMMKDLLPKGMPGGP